MIFVDTSAFYAVLDRDDTAHPRARSVWNRLLSEGTTIFTSNYALVECVALLQARLGFTAIRSFHETAGSNGPPLSAATVVAADPEEICCLAEV